MERAQITTITDVQTLHHLLTEQWCKLDERDHIIIECEQVIACHAQVIADREHIISQHEVRIAEHEALIVCHEQTITHKQARIAALTAEIARLRRVQFAARLENMDPAQRALFDESMAADIAAVDVIRSIALGRKNWLFAGSETAGRRPPGRSNHEPAGDGQGQRPRTAGVCMRMRLTRAG